MFSAVSAGPYRGGRGGIVGSGRLRLPRRPLTESLTDTARHVISCHLIQETTV
jgi:hypothetical protein